MEAVELARRLGVEDWDLSPSDTRFRKVSWTPYCRAEQIPAAN